MITRNQSNCLLYPHHQSHLHPLGSRVVAVTDASCAASLTAPAYAPTTLTPPRHLSLSLVLSRPMEAISSCASNPPRQGYGPSSNGKMVWVTGTTSRGGRARSMRAIRKCGGWRPRTLARGYSAGWSTRVKEANSLPKANRSIYHTLLARL
jgi:hypothetical protein